MTKRFSYMRILFLPFLLCFSCLNANAEQRCHDNAFCIISHEYEESVNYIFQNIQSAPITFDFEIIGENTKPRVYKKVTKVVKPFEKISITQLERNDPEKAWGVKYKFDWEIGNMFAHHKSNAIYRLPYPSGETYRISQGYFGDFSHHDKNAIDFAMPIGTPVLAARAGIVVASSKQNTRKYRNPKLSNYIYIQHQDRTIAKYHHLKFGGIQVEIGQKVSQGELIALSGNTGNSTGPHLHFEVTSPNDGSSLSTYPVRFVCANQGIVIPQKNAWLTAIPARHISTFAKSSINSSENL